MWSSISHACPLHTCGISLVVIMQNSQEKADLQQTKVNATKVRKVCVDGNKLRMGKNGGHRPSSLGSRSIVVVSK